MNDRANASILALSVVLALAFVCGATVFMAGTSSRAWLAASRTGEARASLDAILTSWMERLATATNGSDSRFDLDLFPSPPEGSVTSAEDLSSRINPNWARKGLFEKTSLGSTLTEGRSAAELQQYRVDNGFAADLSGFYGDLVKADALESSFTAYSYADVNTSDEFALTDLYAFRSGDRHAAEEFHQRIQEALAAKRLFEPDDLPTLLFPYYSKVYPAIAARTPMNVNFIPKAVLAAILSYPDYSIKEPEAILTRILDERAKIEIDERRLQSLIGAPREHPIYTYLGTTTWFWRLTIRSKGLTLSAVIARIPADSLSRPKYRIIERKFSP